MSRRDKANADLKKQMLESLKEKFPERSFKDRFKADLIKRMMEVLDEEFPERSLEDILSVIDKNKPLDFMVRGKWQSYSHYEVTFDSTTIWFMDNNTGGRVPVFLKQIERWRKDDASDELKTAIMYLKGFKEKTDS